MKLFRRKAVKPVLSANVRKLSKREMDVLVTAAEFVLCGEVDETLPDPE